MEFKFCGGCNPLYNRIFVYEKIKNEVFSVEVILLNGCHRGCRKERNERSYINIQEFFITRSSDDWNEEEIIQWTLEKNNK